MIFFYHNGKMSWRHLLYGNYRCVATIKMKEFEDGVVSVLSTRRSESLLL